MLEEGPGHPCEAPGFERYGDFPKFGVPLGVPMVWIGIFWGLCWGPLYFRKLPYGEVYKDLMSASDYKRGSY